MAAKLNTQQWIAKAQEVHGFRYDYSKVEYVNAKKPVLVICGLHGPWLCNPDNHISKNRGCPACGGSKKKTLQDFICDARKVHGDRYQYDSATYTNAHTAVSIMCSLHGHFQQSPTSHLSGAGCPACALDERIAVERAESLLSVKARLSEKTGGDVDIVDATFVNINTEATFSCKAHGNYRRFVNAVLYGAHACLKCGEEIGWAGPIDQVSAEKKIREYLGEGIKFQPFEFTGSRHTRVGFICEYHGRWEVSWNTVFKSLGKCPKCASSDAIPQRAAAIRRRNDAGRAKRWASFLEKFIDYHGDRYDYSLATYIDAKTPIKIICPLHGVFEQPPDTHSGAGCKLCANGDLVGLYNERFFKLKPDLANAPATLYLLHLSWKNVECYKVGITRTTLKRRFGAALGKKINVKVLATMEAPLLNVWRQEVNFLKVVQSVKFIYDDTKFLRAARISSSELFTNLPSNWESFVDWTSLNQFHL